MKKILAATAFVVACLAPLATAKAWTTGDFCTTNLTLNFCGSVDVQVSTASNGGSHVQFTVYNTSGITGGDPLAVFTAVGLEGIGNITSASDITNLAVWSNGTNYASQWEVTVNDQVGGGTRIDLLSSTSLNDNSNSTIQGGIASSCSGPPPNLIYTCGTRSVVISFDVLPAFTGDGLVFIKAQGNGSSECIINGTGRTGDCTSTTTVPEPASIVLVGTGLMALGRRASNWRRRNRNV